MTSSKIRVLLLGATGEVGTDVLNGLLEDGSFEITAFTRNASTPAARALESRGIRVLSGDLSAPPNTLVPYLKDIDVLVSALGPTAQLTQLNWVDAAALAGTLKRFVPCGWTTISPRGGVMMIRDEKEMVNDRIFLHKLPFTIVDVGYWHQVSVPVLPAEKGGDALIAPVEEIIGEGKVGSLLTDKRDQGGWLARILKDERTLNKRVVCWADELTQEETWEVTERLAGVEIPRKYVSADAMRKQLDAAAADVEQDTTRDWMKRVVLWGSQYNMSKFVRGDNTLQNAKYLGYVDAKELYPDFKPIRFEEYLQEVVKGSAVRAYEGKNFMNMIKTWT